MKMKAQNRLMIGGAQGMTPCTPAESTRSKAVPLAFVARGEMMQEQFRSECRHVSSIAVQIDGKILIGGNFTSYNGTSGL